MGTIIRIPAIDQQYEYPTGPKGAFAKDVANAINQAKSSYGTDILKASELTGVPARAIMAFMIVENMNLKTTFRSSAGAIGLMQVTPGTGAFAINRQSKSPDFTQEEKNYIKRFVPGAYDSKGNVKSESALTALMGKALTIPAFNIYVGSVLLGMYLMESQRKYGQFRMDHAIIKYNSGIGSFEKKVAAVGLGTADTATLLRNIPFAETKAYIIKALGINGTFDQIIKKNAI